MERVEQFLHQSNLSKDRLALGHWLIYYRGGHGGQKSRGTRHSFRYSGLFASIAGCLQAIEMIGGAGRDRTDA